MIPFNMPSGIDLHVHFREPGLTHKETMRTGLKAAHATGIGTVVDMPNTIPVTDTVENLLQKKKMTENYPGIHIAGGFTNRSVKTGDILSIARNTRILKVFLANSTGDLGIQKRMFEKGLKDLEREKILVMIHAEDPEMVQSRNEGIDENICRPPEAEISAIEYVIDVSKDFDLPMFHITHVTTSKGAYRLLDQQKVSWDVLPKHLQFNSELVEKKGNLAKMNPPLRTETEQKKLLKLFFSEKIPVLTSDHAPHTRKEKSSVIAGAPGVQELYPFLIHHVLCGNVSKFYAENVIFHNPRHILESINLSYTKSTVQVYPSETFVFTPNKILSKCGWSLWENFKFKGKIKGIPLNVE